MFAIFEIMDTISYSNYLNHGKISHWLRSRDVEFKMELYKDLSNRVVPSEFGISHGTFKGMPVFFIGGKLFTYDNESLYIIATNSNKSMLKTEPYKRNTKFAFIDIQQKRYCYEPDKFYDKLAIVNIDMIEQMVDSSCVLSLESSFIKHGLKKVIGLDFEKHTDYFQGVFLDGDFKIPIRIRDNNGRSKVTIGDNESTVVSAGSILV